MTSTLQTEKTKTAMWFDNKQTQPLNAICFIALLAWLAGGSLHAEGTREVAPNPSDSLVMLEVGNAEYGQFGLYGGPENSRLYITINDPNEVVFIGLSGEFNDRGMPLSALAASRYQFRIRKDDGGANPIVHGPYIIDNNNANINSWTEALYGNYAVTTTTPGGELIYQFAPGEAGNYFVEFQDYTFPQPPPTDPTLNIGYWDFTVTLDGTPQQGRVWSRNWAFRTPALEDESLPECGWSRLFNGVLYSYTVDGFVSRIDFNNAGLQGLAFNVAFNSQGPGSSGNLASDRMSIPDENATGGSAQHRIFLQSPDPVAFPDGECGVITAQSTFNCVGDDAFCIDVGVTKPGQVEVIIDFNQNGILDPNSQDVALVKEFTIDTLSACIPWDGLRGDGTMVSFGDTVDLVFIYTQGIQHWSAFDVEYLRNGFCVETIRPSCSPELSADTLLYWDDRNIPDESGTMAPKDGRAGFSCEAGIRTWTNFNVNVDNCAETVDDLTTGYGDKNTINTWWFANTQTFIQANIPLLSSAVAGPDTICVGTTGVLSAEISGSTGSLSYNWAGPNSFSAGTQAIEVAQAGQYCVTITDGLNCSTVACTDLVVISDSGIDLLYPNVVDACVGEMVTLNPVSGSAAGLSFEWSPSAGLDDANSATPTFTVTGDVAYSVTITPPNPVCTNMQTVNVNAVEVPASDFTFDVGCEQGLTINFTGDASNADTYAWDFGDSNTINDTSTEANPAYTYPAPGDYEVTLVTTNQGLCSDTLVQTISVDSVVLAADFTVEYSACDPDSVTVRFTDASINEADNTSSYLWEFSSGQSSNGTSPSITLYGNQTISVTLTIFTEDDCSATITRDITVQLAPPADQFPEDLLVCPGESDQLLPGGDPSYNYSWTPTTGIDDPSSASPVFSPDQTTVYTVAVTSIGADTCTTIETVTVTVPPALNLTVAGGGVVCTPTTTLSASTDVAAGIIWTNAQGDTLSTSAELTVAVSGPADYTATATDANGCTESATVNVNGGPVDFEAPDTAAVCLGEEILLSVTNLDPNDVLTYNWQPSNLFAPGTADDPMPDFLEAVGEYNVTVELTNQFGCTATADVTVAVIDPNVSLSFTSMLDCTGATVEFTNTSTDAFGYVWNFGDGSGPNFEENPVHSYTMAGTYTVTLDLVYDVACVTPFTAEISTQDPQVQAGFAYDIVECSGDSAVIAFTNETINSFNNTTGYAWTFMEAVPATSAEENPTVTVFGSGPLTVTLTVMTANDCENTITETLDIQLAELELVDTLVICPGDTAALNPNGDANLTYNWTPATGLDDPTAVNPMASPAETTTYFVTAYTAVGSDTCFVSDSVVVFVAPALNLDLGDATIITCGEDVTITASVDAPATITWFSAAEGPLPAGPSVTVNPFRTDTIIATATDEYGCTATDTVIVIDNGVDVELQPSDNFTACQGVEETLWVENLDAEDILTYSWMPAEYINGATDTDSVTIIVDEPGQVVFTVIVTNQLGCADTLTAAAEVIVFEADLPDTVAACYDQPTPLNPDGNESYTYDWAPTTGLDLTQPWNPIATLTADQSYAVTMTDPNTGCVVMDTVFVSVSPDINLQTTGDTVLCEPTHITMTATTDIATDIAWYFEGVEIATGGSVTVTAPEGVNVYTAIATDAATGCMDTSEVIIRVQLLTDELPMDTLIACAGEPTPLNPGGEPTLSYVWAPDDEYIDLTNPSNPIVTTDGTDLTYFVTITDPAFGCTVLDTVTVLSGPPINLMTEGDTVLCELIPITMTATTDSPVDIVWYFEGQEIATGTSATVTAPEGVNVYTAIATDAATGCADTSEVVISVQLLTDEIPVDTIFACAGEPTPLNPGGEPTLSYVWSPDDEYIDLTNPSNPIVTTDGTDLTYFVTITDPAFGCTVLDTVTVLSGPPINLMTEGDTVLCELTPITMTATTDSPVDIVWYFEGQEIATGTSATVTAPEGVNVYTAIATDAVTGCADTSEVVISVQLLTDEIPVDTIFACAGEPTPLNPGGEPTLSYVWSPDDEYIDLSDPSNPIVTTDGTDLTYFVTITDPAFGCTVLDTVTVLSGPPINLTTDGDTALCEITTVTLTATTDSPVDIVWYNEGQQIGAGATLDVTPPNGTHTYTAIATDAESGCADTSNVVIQVQLLMDILPAEDVTVCADEPTPINPGGDPELDYTWSPVDGNIDLTNPWNPVVTTDGPLTYFVTVTDPDFGCTVLDTINVDVFPAMNLSVGDDISICGDETLTLTATTDVAPEQVSWFQLPNNTPVGTGTSINIAPVVGTTLYYAEAISPDGCTERDTLQVDNYPINATITEAFVVCEPSTEETLSVVNLDPTQQITVVWEPLGVITDPPIGATVTVNPSITDAFAATVVNQFGCSENLSTTVTVVDLGGDIEVFADPDTLLLMQTSDLTVTGCVGCSYDWVQILGAGDIFPDDEATVTVTPTEPGLNTYEVMVSLLGCVEIRTVDVFVINAICDVDHLFFPNAFSPNGDGENDVLRLRTSFADEILEMELMIYDRWGEEVFRTQDPYQGWDGTFRDEELAPDVYGYYLRVLCPNEEELIQKGNVTLLR